MNSAAPPADLPTQEAAPGEEPLRFLLLTDQAGELPWVVKAIVQVMSPVELVQVGSLAKLVWRLGRERFDSVLLHVDSTDPQTLEACRRQIADVAAIPILDLRDEAAPAASASAPKPESADARAGHRPPRADRRREKQPARVEPSLAVGR